MSALRAGKPKGANIRLIPRGGRPLSAGEVKTQLHEQDVTLKEWSVANNFAYDTVSCVVRGVHKATYGVGHRIAVMLGMKVDR
ncbi:hypothetical protein [Variovorax paradoxus]|uniref:hypothetical protein n=1 Tax=Variovorax paradoxus TaxID=34073 RepID=UPI0009B984C3|nr:hypothetical protein [Variovorax paradoxus]